jgi:menaquinol-cytochrome c reductase iron-sulfur subunit
MANPDETKPPAPPDDKPESGERRRFLSTATIALGACAGGLTLLPAAGAILSPLGRRTVRMSTEPSDVGAEVDFKENQPRKVVIRGMTNDGWGAAESELGAAWVRRPKADKPGDRWTAFSAVCPHLGCAVDYDSKRPAPYLCPCHDSYFGAAGDAQLGPSPRGLDELPVTVRAGRVLVEFHRYVLNQKQKVES